LLAGDHEHREAGRALLAPQSDASVPEAGLIELRIRGDQVKGIPLR
jgi:hypothetical protein